MITAAWRALTTEVRGMHAAAYVLALSALGSSLLALLRDRLLADTFGAGVQLDLYYAAFRIPDIIFVVIASLFSAYVLIPELARRNEVARSREYIDSVALGFFVVMAIVSIVGFLAAPRILSILFPVLMEGDGGATLLTMTRVLLVQPILLGFSNILAAITQHARRYLVYALAPLCYNIGIIAGILVGVPDQGVLGVAFGVVLGALLHVAIQLPSVIGEGYFTHYPRRLLVREVISTIAVSVPRTLALSATHVVTLGLLALAGGLREGSVSVLALAMNLQAVPLAVIGASYSVAAFPTLSRMFSAGDRASFIEHVSGAARHIMFWTAPLIALLVVERAHIVRTVLGSGAFDWTDTRLTAATLALLSFALVAQALTLLIARAYYAAERSLIPFAVNLIVGASSLMTAYALLVGFSDREVLRFAEVLLRVEDVPGVEVLALPFAFAVGSLVGALTLTLMFERHFGGLLTRVSRTFWESITAAGCAGAASYTVLTILGGISEATTLAAVLGHGALSGAVGLGAALFAYALSGSLELKEVIETLSRRTKPLSPVQSSEESLA